MDALLKFTRLIDRLNETIGKLAAWTVLLAALISASNAFVRYGPANLSSNSWLEIQWYLFAGTVMLGAPIVLKLNEHVRVDLLYSKLKGHGPVYVDIFGLVVFLLPVVGVLFWMCVPYFVTTFTSGEMSQNAGGLKRWPVILLLPLGFGLLWLQGVAEIIKRVAYLMGRYQMDTHYEKPVQ